MALGVVTFVDYHNALVHVACGWAPWVCAKLWLLKHFGAWSGVKVEET
jgi:hypothetical protein